ncbi:hypothetical protein G7Y79_00002g006880 [Physcia stellaris]|nr:hypothetical protein G7Y79_00002g006880 [Physcia stellaris]
MFTGIVEAIGSTSLPDPSLPKAPDNLTPQPTSAVTTLSPQDDTSAGGGGTSLTITCSSAMLSDAHLGDSISINGTCLTLTSITPNHLHGGDIARNATAHEPRLLGHFQPREPGARGEREHAHGRALRAGPCGHGRDDREGGARWERVGVSTAAEGCGGVEDGREGWWEVMLIAYTQEKVVMAGKREGEEVNVEVDMVGKYVEKSVRGYLEGLEGEGGGWGDGGVGEDGGEDCGREDGGNGEWEGIGGVAGLGIGIWNAG